MATDDQYTEEPGKPPEPDAPQAEVDKNDDGSVTVNLQRSAEDLPEEVFNLVPFYKGSDKGKKFMAKLVDKVVHDVDDDWDSCEAWREKRKQRWKLMVGDLDEKEFPFEDCANVHVPIMLERCLRLVHRLYGEMFPDRDFLFQAIPTTSLSQERADAITQNDNFQLRKEIPDFFKQNRRALMEFIAHGDAVIWSYRDIPGERNRHEALNCEEIVWPYTFKTTAVDLSDLPRKTRIIQKYRHELRELEKSKAYANVDLLLAREKHPNLEDGKERTVRPVVDKFEGREQSHDDKNAPYELYEYHGRCQLLGQEDERPVVITVHAPTKTMLSLYIREQEDWKDRLRFEREQGEGQAFTALQQSHSEVMAKEQEVQMRLAQPDVPDDERQMLQQELGKGAPPPPEPPQWMTTGLQAPMPARRVPIEYGSHGVAIENPDGSMGLGIGLLLEPFNAQANTAASQFTDSATLSNVCTMIMPDSVRMDPGDKELKPGMIHRVRGVSSEQLDKAFKVIQFPPANPQLLEVVRMATAAADGVSSAPDVLSGEPGKSNETYRGIATRVEQATKQLTVLAQNYLEMLNNVVRNNARLNSIFMKDDEFKAVVDPRTLESVNIKVGRQLYTEDYDIAFTADTRFGGRAQKVSEADQLLGMVTALPPELASQMFPMSFVYEAVVRVLKARNAHDMIRYLGPRPPTPSAQPGMPGMPPGAPPGPGMPPGAPPPPMGKPPGLHMPPPPGNGSPSPDQPIQGPRAAPVQ